MSDLAREEIEELSKEAVKLEQQLKLLLLPKDPLDERNIMLEVGSDSFFATHTSLQKYERVSLPTDTLSCPSKNKCAIQRNQCMEACYKNVELRARHICFVIAIAGRGFQCYWSKLACDDRLE